MKQFIKDMDREHREFGATGFAMFFQLGPNGSGHIQRDRSLTGDLQWSVFFNFKCVHISKGLDSAVKKLEKLGVRRQDLFF
tara:strand:+ start:342 stop:584 length:243 start_codon:yes stop_codon:yes gene_type:complete